jgi:hypothetical protein
MIRGQEGVLENRRGVRWGVVACRLAASASPWLARRTAWLLMSGATDAGREGLLAALVAECESLRTAGRSDEALQLLEAVDLSTLPEPARPEAMAAVRKLAHRLRLSLAGEVDLGAHVAELLLHTLGERLEESGARAMPSRQLGRVNDALREVLALNLLREPFEALAGLEPGAVFDVALASLARVQQETAHWGSLGAKRVLKELEVLVLELREAVGAGESPGSELERRAAR